MSYVRSPTPLQLGGLKLLDKVPINPKPLREALWDDPSSAQLKSQIDGAAGEGRQWLVNHENTIDLSVCFADFPP